MQVHLSLQGWQSKLIIPDWLFLATGTPLSAGSPPMASPGIPPGGRKGSTLDAHHLIGALFGPQIFTPRLARRNLNDHVRSFALLPYFVRPALLPGHALHHKNVRGHHLGWIAFFVVDEQVARDIDLGGVARSFPKPAVARLVWLSLYHDRPAGAKRGFAVAFGQHPLNLTGANRSLVLKSSRRLSLSIYPLGETSHDPSRHL